MLHMLPMAPLAADIFAAAWFPSVAWLHSGNLALALAYVSIHMHRWEMGCGRSIAKGIKGLESESRVGTEMTSFDHE